jgi:hypothetical protein
LNRIVQINQQTRSDFDQALGESFGASISPPIPFDDASPHECCEALWAVLGTNITPTQLAQLSPETIATIAQQFGEYFECEAPTVAQIEGAIDQTLTRWPIGSLGETD